MIRTAKGQVVRRAATALGLCLVSLPFSGCGGGAGTGSPVPPRVGERIVFQSDKSGNFDIWVMNGNGTGQLRLTSNAANDVNPAFSPDRSRIAFSSDRDGQEEIYIMNADGSGQTRLTTDAASSEAPSFSPDGTKIVFKSGNGITLMNADGSNVQVLTDVASFNLNPVFARGGHIVFASNLPTPTNPAPNNKLQLFRINAEGSGLAQLTTGASNHTQPSVSPNGQRIVFTDDRDGSFAIFVMNADGTGEQRLTSGLSGNSHPVFSPDGQRIIFDFNRAGNYDIYTMNADGSAIASLTSDAATERLPNVR